MDKLKELKLLTEVESFYEFCVSMDFFPCQYIIYFQIQNLLINSNDIQTTRQTIIFYCLTTWDDRFGESEI